jgi:8-oxo-dGTP diphosphatase
LTNEKVKEMVIGYIIKDNKVLLIEKKTGLGAGNYNGFGGKVEAGENFEEALIREGKEELGITCLDPREVARINFFENGKKVIFVKAFLITNFSGKPTETKEANPVWFSPEKIPYDKMWEDDKYWLSRVLKGEKIRGDFWFDQIYGNEKKPKLLKHEIKPF